MPAIRIDFPKTGFYTSTWVPDDEWYPLSPQARNGLIFRFIKNRWASELDRAIHATDPGKQKKPNYSWRMI